MESIKSEIAFQLQLLITNIDRGAQSIKSEIASRIQLPLKSHLKDI